MKKTLMHKVFYAVEELAQGKRSNDKPVDQIAIEQITEKLKAPIVATNVRLVASAATKERAESILGSLEATFNQFEAGLGNRIEFTRLKGSAKKKAINDFSLRLFDTSTVMPLNLKELTSMYHLTAAGVSTSRELKQSKAKVAPARRGRYSG
jgi:hypothetical protein